ncbi:hypothetical protein FPV67DRAFT_1508380 [Lyophyllum atratum]|nr:hypothetical protein FPV67DRAFT_1508380 [Lyophyllum atratum]
MSLLPGHPPRVARTAGVRYSPYPLDTSGARNATHRRRHSFGGHTTEVTEGHQVVTRGPPELVGAHHLTQVLDVVEALSRQVQSMERLLERLSQGVDRLEASRGEVETSQAEEGVDSPDRERNADQVEVSQAAEEVEDDDEVSTSTTHVDDVQQKILKRVIRHHLIQPQKSYDSIRQAVIAYIQSNATTLKLDSYVTDSSTRVAIEKYLAAQVRSLKAQLRAHIWKSVDNPLDLEKFAKKIVATHHLPEVPDIIPNSILASFALMRTIAVPLVPSSKTKELKKKNTTGFWRTLETELEELYARNGADRTSEAWISWEKEMINADRAKYRVSTALPLSLQNADSTPLLVKES